MKKALEIILVIAIITLLAFAGYEGYNYYKEWKESQKTNELKMIEALKTNEGVIIKLKNDIADMEKKVVGETLKETTIIKEEAETYNELKDDIIELKKNAEENKEIIKTTREEFEKRIDEFQASNDKILVNTGEKKIVIYEDEEGNLVSLDSGVTITRHRNVEEVITELEAGQPAKREEEKKYAMAFSMIYDLENKDFSPGLSYQLWDWKNLSLNITGYDFEDIKAGMDLCYNINKNIVVGAGARLFTLKDYEFSIDKYYLKAGVEFEF